MRLDVKSNETAEQQAVIQWAHYERTKYPELDNLYHVPNEAKRSVQTASVLKKMGLKAGVPDLILDCPKGKYHGLRIEMKYGTNRPTKAQLEWLHRMRDAGYFVAICYDSEACINTIETYLKLQAGHGMCLKINREKTEKYGVPVL